MQEHHPKWRNQKMAEKAVNSLKGETLVTLAGKEYKARITVNSIMQIEAACGMGIIKLTQKMSEGDIMMSHLIAVLVPSLRGGGNDVQREDVINMVEEAGLVKTTGVVATLLASTLTDNSEEKAAEGKQKEGE